MKILFIVPSYKPAFVYGGPIRSVSALCEALVEVGHDVTVFTTNANGNEDLTLQTGTDVLLEGVRVIYFKRWTSDHSNFSPGLLVRLIKKVNTYDIVHIQSWWNAVVMPAALLCLMKGVKPIISPRGSITSYTFNYRNTFYKRILQIFGGKAILRASAFHATSSEEVNELKKWVDDNLEIYVLPNLLNLPAKVLGHYVETDRFKLIYLSRIDPKKNLELIFRVIRMLEKVPVSLTILGEGEEEYVSKLKEESHDIPGIIWKGNVDGDEKYTLLAESDLLILPSFTENYGNVIFESLSQGTPVVISGNVGAKDYVEVNQLGWIVEGGDLKWQQTLEAIWLDKSARADIRHRAPGCIRNDFRNLEQVKIYEEMYLQHRKKTITT